MFEVDVEWFGVHWRMRFEREQQAKRFCSIYRRFATEQDGEPAGLTSLSVDGRIHIDDKEVTVSDTLDPEAVVQLLSVRRALSLADDFLFIHAAALAFGSRGVLLIGQSGSGKTTLAAQLVRAGANFLGDEVVGISRKDGRLYAFPRSLSLRPESVELLGLQDKLSEMPLFPSLDYRHNIACDPDLLRPSCVIETADLHTIILFQLEEAPDPSKKRVFLAFTSIPPEFWCGLRELLTPCCVQRVNETTISFLQEGTTCFGEILQIADRWGVELVGYWEDTPRPSFEGLAVSSIRAGTEVLWEIARQLYVKPYHADARKRRRPARDIMFLGRLVETVAAQALTPGDLKQTAYVIEHLVKNS